jgi:hypothetical protein
LTDSLGYRYTLGMLVTMRLSVQAGEQIEKLVRSGKYASFENFARVALENQLVAEADGLPLWGAALRSAVAGTTLATGVQEPDDGRKGPTPPRVPNPTAAHAARERPGSAETRVEPARADVDALHRELRGLLHSPIRSVPEPVNADPTGAERWPWGQWNRLFPLKLACRVILCEAKEGRWMAPGPALERIGEHARVAGRVLLALDRAAGRGRDEALAVALPGDDSKSLDRFVSQFVGHVTKAGPRSGAACVYQLCAFQVASLGLTESGLAFARLPNPFLDGAQEADTLLSKEERQFLIDLIGERVPGERKSFLAVMGAIYGGSTRFDDVVAAARKAAPKGWSDAMMRTQVSGTMARLYDLDLVGKERAGQRVSYALTKSGEVLNRRWKKGS